MWFSTAFPSHIQSSEGWRTETVVDAREVIPHEIWAVTVQRKDNTTTTFYVSEQTCEAIGRPPPTGPQQSQDVGTKGELRADWSSYVEQRASGDGVAVSSFLANIKWDHFEEYDRGISRFWLKRIISEGKYGEFKKEVAQRYVLASVVGNR